MVKKAKQNAVDFTVAQRQSTHGEYPDTATVAQAIKDAMRSGKNWDDLPPFMKESFEQIATKCARALTGDQYEAEHWHDVQGYAHLVEREL